MKVKNINQDAIDWSMNNAQIAKKFKVDPSSIHRLRASLGIKPVIQKDRVVVQDWRSLDWENMNNSQMAKFLGCSPSTVSQKRKEYAKHRPRPRHIALKWEIQDWTKDNTTIAKERGVSYSSVSCARRRYANGVKGKRNKLLDRIAVMEVKLSERKTVHQWLNGLGIPKEEFEKPICLLRRLRILCDKYMELTKPCSTCHGTKQIQTTEWPALYDSCPDCK